MTLSDLSEPNLAPLTVASGHWPLMAQSVIDVEIIKQYPERQQVERKVKVQVPGKHFPSLTAAEQKQFCERHKFPASRSTTRAGGVAHTGPGIRFVCESDAIDDPDCKGFWTMVALWNRWRHATYKDDREAAAAAAAAAGCVIAG